MNTKLLCTLFGLMAGVILSNSAHAALYDNGDGLIYDSINNITWLADADYATTSGADYGYPFPIQYVASDFAHNLNYQGITGWRLPTVTLAHHIDPLTGEEFTPSYVVSTEFSRFFSQFTANNVSFFKNFSTTAIYWTQTYADDTSNAYIGSFSRGDGTSDVYTYGLGTWAGRYMMGM